MPRWTKGNSGYAGKGKGQGKSALPTDVPVRYDEGFLDELDGRAEVTRTLRQRHGALVGDLGGLDCLSYQEQSVCRRIIHLERLIERQESILLQGGSVDLNYYLSAVNCLSGLLSKIGLKRKAKQLSLKDYLCANNKPEPHPAPTNQGGQS